MRPHAVRTFGLLLAAATLATAVVVTQWPFDYHVTRFAVHLRWSRIEWSWFPRYPAGAINQDLVLNLLMLIPLGLGFGLWRRSRGIRLVLESLVLGSVLSAALELAQLATRDRTTSFADAWRNTLSCVVGCLLALAIRSWLDARARAASAQ